MQLEVVNRDKKCFISTKFLHSALQFIEKALLKKYIIQYPFYKTLVIVFVPINHMQQLHKQFLKKNHPTDILSFYPIQDDYLGEIVICREQIKSQTKTYGLNIKEQIVYLILHGILHLLGYTHNTDSTSKKMYFIQDTIFNQWKITCYTDVLKKGDK